MPRASRGPGVLDLYRVRRCVVAPCYRVAPCSGCVKALPLRSRMPSCMGRIPEGIVCAHTNARSGQQTQTVWSFGGVRRTCTRQRLEAVAAAILHCDRFLFRTTCVPTNTLGSICMSPSCTAPCLPLRRHLSATTACPASCAASVSSVTRMSLLHIRQTCRDSQPNRFFPMQASSTVWLHACRWCPWLNPAVFCYFHIAPPPAANAWRAASFATPQGPTSQPPSLVARLRPGAFPVSPIAMLMTLRMRANCLSVMWHSAPQRHRPNNRLSVI